MLSRYILFILLIPCTAISAKFISPYIVQLDDEFSPYAMIVEKSTHQLYLYKNNQGLPELVKKYQVATGKITGLKLKEGDKKTPEGIYNILQFRDAENLIKSYGKTGEIYGPGALTLNYPNAIDKMLNRQGSGIWIHSTDDDSRIEKGLDSRGCVVLRQKEFNDLHQYTKLKNTPVIIVQDKYYLPKENWHNKRQELIQFVDNWAMAWQEKDFETYIGHYSKSFSNARKGNYYQYRNYKRRIFRKKDKPIINFSNKTILFHNNYAVVRIKQDYQSKFINDIGEKTLILSLDSNYNWKIIKENWKAI